jgi:hypothetical protein
MILAEKKFKHSINEQWQIANGGNVFCFLSSLSPPPPSHPDSVWLPVISPLLINTVSPVRACLSIWLERFRGSQKEDERGALSIHSSMLFVQGPPSLISYISLCPGEALHVPWWVITRPWQSRGWGRGSHPPSRDQGETLARHVVFWSCRGLRMWFSPSLQRSRWDTCRTCPLLVLQRMEDVVLTLPPEIKVRHLQDRSSSGPS